jgi:hypothetical protein
MFTDKGIGVAASERQVAAAEISPEKQKLETDNSGVQDLKLQRSGQMRCAVLGLKATRTPRGANRRISRAFLRWDNG